MIKKTCFAISLLILLYSCNNDPQKKDVPKKETPAYTKADLKKMSWIEGNWKGMDSITPFYEVYRFLNDSTVESTGYEWNGKDSSNSTHSTLHWKDSSYYLGDDMMSWKISTISDSAVYMLPAVAAQNDVSWKLIDKNSWEAVLKFKGGDKKYRMERIDHFPKK